MVIGLVGLTLEKQIYDTVRSYVTILNMKNFDAQVTNNRQKGITITHFYQDNGKISLSRNFYLLAFLNILLDGASKGVAGLYENFAKENKGMFRITSIDCSDFASICNKEHV